MAIRFILLIPVLLFISCTQHSKTNTSNHIPLPLEKRAPATYTPDTIQLRTQPPKEKFDVSLFQSQIDSFFAVFTGTPASYHLSIDTLANNHDRKVLADTALLGYLLTHSDRCIHYTFEDPQSHRNLDFKIIEIQFRDSSQCNRVFRKLDAYANTKNPIDNFGYVPCLTYQNDRILKGKEKLFWLDHGCRFSFKTHLEYLAILKRTLINFISSDSIVCKCGEVIRRE